MARYSFMTCDFTFSVVNPALFWRTVHDPKQRNTIQPSLILSLLAMSKLVRSSEWEDGESARQEAREHLSFERVVLG